MRGRTGALTLVLACSAALGCKSPDARALGAYIDTNTALSQVDLELTVARCARVAMGSSWKAAEEDTRPMFQRYVAAGDAAVAAGDALKKSDPPGWVLDRQTTARALGKAWSDRKDAFQRACVERRGQGPELDASRATMVHARDEYVAALQAMRRR